MVGYSVLHGDLKRQITVLSKSIFQLALSKVCFPWRFGV